MCRGEASGEECSNCVVRRVYHEGISLSFSGIGQCVFRRFVRFQLITREGDLGQCCGRCDGAQGCQCDRDVRKVTPVKIYYAEDRRSSRPVVGAGKALTAWTL
ncbi:hypothetical protein T4D_4788 [Trichinella pseudospiralis]|uniref:Uncharacterized protein n=1 Tax=Trichinella pseudospiralis TaxID=6337 RepID=A0A0V1G3C7_TRIPS|nr:hypothetical protein T4D_4788 [Trichinella pseudospiralis]